MTCLKLIYGIYCTASPANTLDDNDQVAPHCALCMSLLTIAPCCTGMSKSDTSEPPHNWKDRMIDVTIRKKQIKAAMTVSCFKEEVKLVNSLDKYKKKP